MFPFFKHIEIGALAKKRLPDSFLRRAICSDAEMSENLYWGSLKN